MTNWKKIYIILVYNFICYVVCMTEQEARLNEFKALTLEGKREKLLAIFEFAKDKFDFSETAINYLSSNTLPDELVMEKFYEFVVEVTIAARERMDIEKTKQDEKVHDLYDKAEEEARKDAEDADTLLDLINLL